jgi:hypothetical protein
MTLVFPPETGVPDPVPDQPRYLTMWPTVVAMTLVISCTTALLVTGSPLQQALLGAAGMALTGNEVARRVINDAGPMPVVIVAGFVSAFGAVLIVLGYSLAEAALGAGIVGLIAGEISGRMFGDIPRPWRGV